MYLAGFDFQKVRYFISNYERFRGNFEMTTLSPTKTVVDVLEELEGHRKDTR